MRSRNATFQCRPQNADTEVAASGRFIQIQARLNANASDQSPILYDLSVSSLDSTCDIDGDGDIDRNDIAAIVAARNTTVPPSNPVMDADGNGVINVNDARACTLRCTRPQCAP